MRHNSEANHHIIITSPRRARKRNGATHLARVYVSGSYVAGGAGTLNSKGLRAPSSQVSHRQSLLDVLRVRGTPHSSRR